MHQTEQTKDRYLKKAKAIRLRFTHDTGLAAEADCEAFNTWMDALYVTLAPASRRQYHAALAHYQSIHHPECMPGPIPPGLPNRVAIRAQYGKRGPGQKSKAFPAHVERALIDTLSKARQRSGSSIYITWAHAFLLAGVTFGLRPSEWLRARFVYLEDGSAKLHVINAKHDGERAFGPTRTLVINEDVVADQERGAAEWLIGASLQMTVEQFQDVIDRTAQQLRRMIKLCGAPCRPRSGNSITLYTARHQFAANAKLAGLTLVEIAALMGHASIDTAAEHYGRRQYGRSGNRMAVKPDPENVREVQAIVDQKDQKKAPGSSFGPR